MRPASWSAGIPARIRGGTAPLPKMDGPWRRVPVRSVGLTDLGGHRKFASAGKDARGPGICSFQSPSGVLGGLQGRAWRYRRHGSRSSAHVSVPFRGFRGLQGVRLRLTTRDVGCVSVPFRGFRGLQERDDDPYWPSRLMFQSPSGVLGVCRAFAVAEAEAEAVVSVPFRGFRGLQAAGAKRTRSVDALFQSPSGVLGVCRLVLARFIDLILVCEFQSPSGVLGVCRLMVARLDRRDALAFQSPSGVLGVCRDAAWLPRGVCGPIWFQSPSGVLGVCRSSLSPQERRDRRGVSVPFRGFRGLQERQINLLTTTFWQFQSPSGVLGVCRTDAITIAGSGKTAFQSPSGVLGVCRM